MNVLIDNKKGWVEAIIDNNCDNNKFYSAAIILEKDLQLNFISKINDFDTFYWDFDFKGSELTLYHNVYLGLSVFPKALKQASAVDNENVIEIAELLFEKLKYR